MIILSLQIIFFFGYLTYIVWRFGVLKSISDSWYKLEPKKQWMFTLLFCYPIGILQMLHGGVLNFLSGGFLAFVGVATQFKDWWKPTRVTHVIGATGSIVLAILSLIFYHNLYYSWLFIPVSLLIFKDDPNKTWWVEVVAFVVIACSIYFKLITV